MTTQPCPVLDDNPPSVADRLSSAATEDLVPGVVRLAPRGPAWGTDEAGDGRGASPRLLELWHALADVFRDLVQDAHAAMVETTYPTAITARTLADWEADYGLPDVCLDESSPIEQRIRHVRLRFVATGGSSPAYFVCLAQAFGYEITIEEPGQFHCDDSECGGDDEVAAIDVTHIWIVTAPGFAETFFRVDEGECDHDPLEGYVTDDVLECILRREAPSHTTLVFNFGA